MVNDEGMVALYGGIAQRNRTLFAVLQVNRIIKRPVTDRNLISERSAVKGEFLLRQAYLPNGSNGSEDLWTHNRSLPSEQRRNTNVLSTITSSPLLFVK